MKLEDRVKADEYQRGYRDGLREAITWLHARAEEMNDPHAKAILNTAAFHLGVETAKKRRQRPIAGTAADQGSASGESPDATLLNSPAHRLTER